MENTKSNNKNIETKNNINSKKHLELMTVENINRILWQDKFSKLCGEVNGKVLGRKKK